MEAKPGLSMSLPLREEEIITPAPHVVVSALGKSQFVRNKELNGNKRNTGFDVRMERLRRKTSGQKEECGNGELKT